MYTVQNRTVQYMPRCLTGKMRCQCREEKIYGFQALHFKKYINWLPKIIFNFFKIRNKQVFQNFSFLSYILLRNNKCEVSVIYYNWELLILGGTLKTILLFILNYLGKHKKFL